MMVGYQWLDEVALHKTVAQHTTLDELADERRHTYETASAALRNKARVPTHVLHRCDCEPPKDVFAQLINEGSCLSRTVRSIVELLEEACNAWMGPTLIPCHARNALNKFVDGRELFAEDVFNPVLYLRYDFVVLRRRSGKGGKQGADLQGDIVPPVVETRLCGHRYGTMKSVAGAWTHNVKRHRPG